MSYTYKKSTPLLLPLAISITAMTGASAFAQESRKTALEEVTVTGQKIERSLQDTPDSVVVVNTIQIEDRDITDFDEFLAQTANANSDNGQALNIRGIDAFNVSGSGDSFLASVYVDGAPLPRRLIDGGFSTWDASQVELLRGPQSTLQGRNALAGAVVITTTEPTQEWEGRFRAQFGEHGEQELAFAGGGGLIEDQLAFRFSAELEEFDGFNRNITRNERSDFSDDELYRLKFLWTPKGVDDFSALLSLTHATKENGDLTVEVPENGGNPFERIVTSNDEDRRDIETDIVSLKLDYQFNDNWSLTSISTYSDVFRGNLNDIDNGAEASITNQTFDNNQTLSQEFRLTFEYEKFEGVIGGYYFDQEIDTLVEGDRQILLSDAGITSPFFQNQFGLDQATADFVVSQFAPVDPAILDNRITTERNVSSVALFADATYHINDKLDIFGGFRWDREKQDNDSDSIFVFSNQSDLPDPSSFIGPFAGLAPLIAGVNAGLIANVADANLNAPLVNSTNNEILPKLGVSYHWTDDLTTSFSVQRGFRSGGVGVNNARSSSFQFDSEFTTNYELSLRSVWLDGALTANANIFYIDWEDQQIAVQLSSNSFDTETQNAGASTVKGFEVELNYLAADSLTLYGSLGQANTKFDEFDVVIPSDTGEPTVFDLSGRSFEGSPEWTANVGATYKPDNGFVVNVNANYASDSSSEINPEIDGRIETDADFDLRNDSRVIVNAQVGYEWNSFGIFLIASNLFDEEYISSANAFEGQTTQRQSIGDPQQFSVSLRGRF